MSAILERAALMPESLVATAGMPLIRLRGVTKLYGSGQAELLALKGADGVGF